VPPRARRGGRRALGVRGWLVVACSTFGVALLSSAPALAAAPQRHVFSFSFGERGPGKGEFGKVSAIAVSATTGDVYVADSEDNRIEQFAPVLNEAGETVSEKFVQEVPVGSPSAITVDNCTHASAPCTKLEDPSVGDVYVLGTHGSKKGLDKFNANLELAPNPTPKVKGAVGLAVDGHGTLYVLASSEAGAEIRSFSDAEPNAPNETVTAAGIEPQPPFAVDAKGDFYVGHVPNPALTETLPGSPLNQVYSELLTVEGGLAEIHERAIGLLGKLEKGTGKELVHALSFEYVSSVAADPSSDEVYAANVATVANEPTASIAVLGPAGGEGGSEPEQLIERLTAPGLREAAGVAVSPTSGTVYVTDGSSDQVYVFNTVEHAARLTKGRPAVAAVASEPVPASTVALKAQVSADGTATNVHFEYGSGPCPSSCTSTPVTVVPAGFATEQVVAEVSPAPGAYDYRVIAENASGTTTSAPQNFSTTAILAGLPDGRKWEIVSPPEKDGAEVELPVLGEGGLEQAAENGDAITYIANGVIPAGSESEGARGPEPNQILSSRSPTWSSHDLNTSNSTGAGASPGIAPEYEFFSPNLALALVHPFPGAAGPFASPPISPLLPGETPGEQENTIYLHNDVPAPGASQDVFRPEPSEAASYEAARESGEAMAKNGLAGAQGFLALVNKANGAAAGLENFGATQGNAKFGIVPTGATPDLSHVVIENLNATIAGCKVSDTLYEWNAIGQQLKPVSVLPASEGGKLACSGLLGSLEARFGSVLVSHAISNDGSLVYWTQTGSGSALYLRDTEEKHEQTLAITPQLASQNIGFQGASANGSKVYFTDNVALTPGSNASKSYPDLYVAEVSVAGGHLSLTSLTDLTEQKRESAGVLAEGSKFGGVLGIGEPTEAEAAPGERGPYVYFVANAALAPGAHRGNCSNEANQRPPGTTCNLYVRHYDEASGEWEPTRLVAALSAEDAPDWDGNALTKGTLRDETARVSPNGRYIAFMSNRRLTGYDNIDVNEELREGTTKHADEEVFLYDTPEQRLVCASCNPSGERPAGVLDPGVLGSQGRGEGLGLVIDRQEIWGPDTKENGEAENRVDHWLAGNIPGWTPIDSTRALYQPRYLSNSGRLFFNSPDHLTPEATGPKAKVYEYEPGAGGCSGSGGCIGLISSGTAEHEAAFVDASASGNDVFFITNSQLVPQDTDSSYDIYDAHVCSEGSPCPSSPPSPKHCEGEECQGSFELPPAAGGSGTAVSGPGNVLLAGSGVLGEKAASPPTKPPTKPSTKPLTRAQKLEKALATCKKDKSKPKRLACEKQARKKYGPVKPTGQKSAAVRGGR
jgi:DNA-binding beta-propeller fold protein YncE